MMVLIQPELADRLSLKHHKLKTSEIVDVAISKGEQKATALTHYIVLKPVSLDHYFSSHPVEALVA